MRRLSLLVALVLLLSLPGMAASADSGSATLDFFIFPEDALFPGSAAAVAVADNGDTIEVVGDGTITIHDKSASGSGTFEHRDSDGNLVGSGTWEAVELLRYHSYGPADPDLGLPPGSEGGRALVLVEFDPDGPGIPNLAGTLWLDCVLGDFPDGAIEGVRVNVYGLINFNKIVSGFTLFIRE